MHPIFSPTFHLPERPVRLFRKLQIWKILSNVRLFSPNLLIQLACRKWLLELYRRYVRGPNLLDFQVKMSRDLFEKNTLQCSYPPCVRKERIAKFEGENRTFGEKNLLGMDGNFLMNPISDYPVWGVCQNRLLRKRAVARIPVLMFGEYAKMVFYGKTERGSWGPRL